MGDGDPKAAKRPETGREERQITAEGKTYDVQIRPNGEVWFKWESESAGEFRELRWSRGVGAEIVRQLQEDKNIIFVTRKGISSDNRIIAIEKRDVARPIIVIHQGEPYEVRVASNGIVLVQKESQGYPETYSDFGEHEGLAIAEGLRQNGYTINSEGEAVWQHAPEVGGRRQDAHQGAERVLAEAFIPPRPAPAPRARAPEAPRALNLEEQELPDPLLPPGLRKFSVNLDGKVEAEGVVRVESSMAQAEATTMRFQIEEGILTMHYTDREGSEGWHNYIDPEEEAAIRTLLTREQPDWEFSFERGTGPFDANHTFVRAERKAGDSQAFNEQMLPAPPPEKKKSWFKSVREKLSEVKLPTRRKRKPPSPPVPERPEIHPTGHPRVEASSEGFKVDTDGRVSTRGTVEVSNAIGGPPSTWHFRITEGRLEVALANLPNGFQPEWTPVIPTNLSEAVSRFLSDSYRDWDFRFEEKAATGFEGAIGGEMFTVFATRIIPIQEEEEETGWWTRQGRRIKKGGKSTLRKAKHRLRINKMKKGIRVLMSRNNLRAIAIRRINEEHSEAKPADKKKLIPRTIVLIVVEALAEKHGKINPVDLPEIVEEINQSLMAQRVLELCSSGELSDEAVKRQLVEEEFLPLSLDEKRVNALYLKAKEQAEALKEPTPLGEQVLGAPGTLRRRATILAVPALAVGATGAVVVIGVKLIGVVGEALGDLVGGLGVGLRTLRHGPSQIKKSIHKRTHALNHGKLAPLVGFLEGCGRVLTGKTRENQKWLEKKSNGEYEVGEGLRGLIAVLLNFFIREKEVVTKPEKSWLAKIIPRALLELSLGKVTHLTWEWFSRRQAQRSSPRTTRPSGGTTSPVQATQAAAPASAPAAAAPEGDDHSHGGQDHGHEHNH